MHRMPSRSSSALGGIESTEAALIGRPQLRPEVGLRVAQGRNARMSAMTVRIEGAPDMIEAGYSASAFSSFGFVGENRHFDQQ
jgi:hypothetical protein